jgi:predicted dehydrogenase
MSPLWVAIVGCWRMGREHARACAALGAEIAMLVDHDSHRAAALVALYPGSVAEVPPNPRDWRTLDAAFVCTPPGCRVPVDALHRSFESGWEEKVCHA